MTGPTPFIQAQSESQQVQADGDISGRDLESARLSAVFVVVTVMAGDS